MPYDLFWRGPINAFWYYQKKYEIEQKEKRKKEDEVAWLQGLYFREALTSVYHMFNPYVERNSKKYPYPKLPYNHNKTLDEESKKELERNVSLINEHNLSLSIKVSQLNKKQSVKRQLD